MANLDFNLNPVLRQPIMSPGYVPGYIQESLRSQPATTETEPGNQPPIVAQQNLPPSSGHGDFFSDVSALPGYKTAFQSNPSDTFGVTNTFNLNQNKQPTPTGAEFSQKNTSGGLQLSETAQKLTNQANQQPQVDQQPIGNGPTALDNITSAVQYLDQMTKTNNNLNYDKYEQDVADWRAKKSAMYLDPYSDAKPDVNKMLQSMPSATDKLTSSGWAGQVSGKPLMDKSGNINWDNPRAYDPTSLAAGKLFGQEGDYVYEQAQQGAVQGFLSGGWVGGIIGGVEGLITGFCGWNQAKSEDDSQAQKAKDDAELALKVWEKNQAYKRMAGMAYRDELAKQQTQQRVASTMTTLQQNRQRLWDMITQGQQNEQSQQQQRQATYARM